MILDADVLIDLLRERPEAELWLQSRYELPLISGMAALEAVYGAQDSIELLKVNSYLRPFEIVWPNENDAQNVRSLAKAHLSHGIELIDVFTACIAIRCNVPLATFNLKHFKSIPGLAIVQPYTRF